MVCTHLVLSVVPSGGAWCWAVVVVVVVVALCVCEVRSGEGKRRSLERIDSHQIELNNLFLHSNKAVGYVFLSERMATRRRFLPVAGGQISTEKQARVTPTPQAPQAPYRSYSKAAWAVSSSSCVARL